MKRLTVKHNYQDGVEYVMLEKNTIPVMERCGQFEDLMEEYNFETIEDLKTFINLTRIEVTPIENTINECVEAEQTEDPFTYISRQIGEKIIDLIVKDLAELVEIKYGTILNKENFKEVIKRYNKELKNE